MSVVCQQFPNSINLPRLVLVDDSHKKSLPTSVNNPWWLHMVEY
jgi:hypothetical protein